MTNDLGKMTERLVAANQMICEDGAAPGVPEGDIILIKKKFAAWSFPLPDGLLEVWRVCAGTGRHERGRSLLKDPLGRRSLDEIESDELAEYDVERYGYLNLGNSAFVSLTMNRDGRISLDAWDFDLHPETYPYRFEEGFARYIEAVEAEISEGVFEDEEN